MSHNSNRFAKSLPAAALFLMLLACTPSAPCQAASPDQTSAAAKTDALPKLVAIAIHPLKEDTTAFGWSYHGTTLRCMALSTRMLIWFATGIDNPSRVKGMPKWAGDTKYDIVAKIDASSGESLDQLTGAQARAMLRSILSERFQFSSHFETERLPALALVVGRGGLKHMTPQEPNQTSHPEVPCVWMAGGIGHYKTDSCRIADLVNGLNQVDDLEVLDRTGLSGGYAFELHYDPTATASYWNGNRFPATNIENAQWPSLYSALPEQLGLRLVPIKEDFPVLVIDRIAPPSDN